MLILKKKKKSFEYFQSALLLALFQHEFIWNAVGISPVKNRTKSISAEKGKVRQETRKKKTTIWLKKRLYLLKKEIK